MQDRRRLDENGFTLIELLVVMIIGSILMGLVTQGWSHYARSVALRGTATDISQVLRNAQQDSYAQAISYCVSFNTGSSTYQLFKYACSGSGSQAVGTARSVRSSKVTIANPSFRQSDNSQNSTVTFDPRGSASKGSVEIRGSWTSRKYVISVEGMTGHVTVSPDL